MKPKDRDDLLWLTTCPASDVNFIGHLKSASTETLQLALKMKKDLGKTTRNKIQAQINRKSYPKISSSRDLRTDNKKAKSYPGTSKAGRILADNIVFCVNGVSVLDGFIQRRSGELEDKISQIERRLGNFHTKNIKGHEYWYVWNDTGYEYVGKENPRPALQEQIKKIEAQIGEVKKELGKALIARLGPHAVLDTKVIGRFQQHEDCIPVNKIIKAAGGKA